MVALTLLCVGDSTTNQGGITWSYRGHLPHRFTPYGHITTTGADMVSGTHSGIFGQTTVAWASPFSPNKSGWADTLQYRLDTLPEPDVVVVIIGANDVNFYRPQMQDDTALINTIITGYHAIENVVHTKYPGKPCILAKIPPFDPSQVNDNALIADLVDAVDLEVWDADTYVLDLHTGFETDGTWHRDTIHWNGLGDAFVAAELITLLDSLP